MSFINKKFGNVLKFIGGKKDSFKPKMALNTKLTYITKYNISLQNFTAYAIKLRLFHTCIQHISYLKYVFQCGLLKYIFFQILKSHIKGFSTYPDTL